VIIMHLRKLKEVTQSIEYTEDIVCNKCGNSLRREEAGDPPIFCGLTECYVEGEYYSPVLPDGVSYKFDLCEKCVMELINSFQVPAEKTDWKDWLAEK